MAAITNNLQARLPLLLLCANVLGAVIYVWRASSGWAIPSEHCEIPVTGEPIVWGIAILPVILVFFSINFLWVFNVLQKRRWTDLSYFAATALAWLAAIAIDFNHHC